MPSAPGATAVVSPSTRNRGGPSGAAPATLTMRPCPPVSDAPKPSTTSIVGTRSSSADFTDGDSGAPPESIVVSDASDQRPGQASSSSASGSANASPTTTTNDTD